MAKNIRPDAFWDSGAGGGVRCSSTGEAASQYNDPSTQSFESTGRSLASLLPGSYGLRGVVIPRAMPLGGSRGFDPNKPRLVNIDPDIKGQACVVDMSKITKELMEEAFAEAATNPLCQNDIRLLASQTYHNLAVGYEPVGMDNNSQIPIVNRRQAPLGDLSGYVAPKAAPGGGQVPDEPLIEPLVNDLDAQAFMSPSVSPRALPQRPIQKAAASFSPGINPRNFTANVGAPPPEATVFTDSNGYAQSGIATRDIPKPVFKDQTTPKQMPQRRIVIPSGPPEGQYEQQKPIMQLPATPGTKVTFETEGWGTFEAMYHAVIKNDCLLVLVYNTKFKDGMKFFPPATDKMMALRIDGSDKVYLVHSHGTKFTHADYEYCVLIVEQDQRITEGEE